MRKFKLSIIFVVSFFVLHSNAFTQDGGTVSQGQITEIEKQYSQSKIVDVSKLSALDKELKLAIESKNTQLEQNIRNQIIEITKDNIVVPNQEDRDYPASENIGTITQPDWLTNDVLVYSGDIGQTGTDHRRIAIKMGEDGNLYSAFIRRPVTGTNGRIDVHKSTDGGTTWAYVQAVTSATAYFGQVAMTVEVRSPGDMDSTRIFLFYSRSVESDFSGATINYVSFLRDGSGWKGGVSVLTPPTGSKLLYPSAVSDGQYWNNATYIGVTCGEYDVDSTKMKNLHFARTTNWGDSYTTSVINDGYPSWGDWFPVSAFKTSSTDSIYIAVERRFSTSPSQLRVIATPWTPSTGFKRYSLTDSVNLPYTKPDITIVQDASSLPKKILVACMKDGQAIYNRSMDGGSTWTLNSTLSQASEKNISFVSISSDSNATSEGYIVAAFQKSGGDTIITRRGIPGSLGDRIVKPNEFNSSVYNAPVVAMYNQSGTKSAALLYTGLASNYTNNVYFDGEHLVTDVSSEAGTPESYSLQQNYPNPFNPNTTIKFSLPEQTNVKIKIFNSIGQEITTLLNTEIAAGNHAVDFNAASLSSGVYFYRIETPNFTSTKKMILIK
jgi:hypothetical protein